LDVSARWTVNRNPALGTADCPFQDTAYSREGSLVAVATCEVQLWNFPGDGVPILLERLDAFDPRGIAFDQDGTLLASANGNGTISLWKVNTFNPAEPLSTIINAHVGAVTAVAISPDGNTLASGGEDQDIILWNITDPEHPSQRVTLQGHTGAILNGGIFFVPDGKAIISASKEEVIFWDNDPQSWIEKACGLAGRNFTQSEWSQHVGPTPYHATCPNLPVSEK
jgi:WD40 repeat protein